MSFRYGAPSTDSSCLLDSRSMICTGHRNSTSASTRVIPVPSMAATPMARLMLSMSFLPQYWLTRMPRPLWTPNTMEISRNTGTLAVVTAAIWVLPSQLTISVSMRLQREGNQILQGNGTSAATDTRKSPTSFQIFQHMSPHSIGKR